MGDLAGQDEAEKAEGVAADPEPEEVEDPASLESVQDGVDDQGERQDGQRVGPDDPVTAGDRQGEAGKPHQCVGDVQGGNQQVDQLGPHGRQAGVEGVALAGTWLADAAHRLTGGGAVRLGRARVPSVDPLSTTSTSMGPG